MLLDYRLSSLDCNDPYVSVTIETCRTTKILKGSDMHSSTICHAFSHLTAQSTVSR